MQGVFEKKILDYICTLKMCLPGILMVASGSVDCSGASNSSEARYKSYLNNRKQCSLEGIVQPFKLKGMTRLIRSAVKNWRSGNF
jgi:hypothetical protein